MSRLLVVIYIFLPLFTFAALLPTQRLNSIIEKNSAEATAKIDKL